MVTREVFLHFLALMPASVNFFSILPPSRELCNMSKFKREDEESQYGFWRYWRLGLELLEVWKRLGGVGSQFYF